MKIAYVSVFFLVGVGVLVCMLRAKGDRKSVAVVVRKLLGCVLGAVLANIVIVAVVDKNVCMAAYGVFFVCIDWFLYFMLRFCFAFSRVNEARFLRRWILWAFLLLDNLMLAANCFHPFLFTCKEVRVGEGVLCCKPVFRGLYNIHLALCCLMALGCLLVLAYKAMKSSEIYREKYLLVLILFGVTVVFDTFQVFSDNPFHLSVLGYAFIGMIIYYYGVLFVPGELVRRILSLVVKEMHDAMFILDEDGRCIHVNDRAGEGLEREGLNTEDMEQKIAEWDGRYGQDGSQDYTFSLSRQTPEGRKHYHVRCQRLHNAKNHYLGCSVSIHDRTEETAQLERERYAATHDELTGLYNRKYFLERVAERLEEDPGESYLIVCCDICDFKMLNDVFGTEKGDGLLQSIAQELRNQTLEGEIYGRLGGDRFGLLMKQENYQEEVFTAATQSLVERIGEFSYPVRICMGVYEIGDRALPARVMCDRAFMALNTVKRDRYGRNIAYYNEALRKDILLEQEFTAQLKEALRQRQIRIYLQPQVNGEGKVLGAEALVRWSHPERGMINPGEFIGIFEKNGLIVELDQYVWEMACMQLQKWKEMGQDDMYLSVNISPRDFFFMDIHQRFTELVEKYEIDPGKLKLEITETAVMTDMEKQLRMIDRLREAGFVVEMDDFGSGYSSLNMLKNIRVDVIKIDMAFLGQSDDEVRARVILRTVVELSRQLEIPVITEGVETAEQVAFLKAIGCGMFQGYYFARPMEIEDFEQKYMRIGA